MPQQPDDQTMMVEMIFPEQANHYGTLFGGNALSLMARAAFVAAARRARGAGGHGAVGAGGFHHARPGGRAFGTPG